ncbi:MAG: hypothetical protein RL284_410, partial [Bacteroidota bacterium]
MSSRKNDISRREFILKAASAAVVAPLLISQAKNISAPNKLRHVCIGVGGMGWHDLNKFKSHPDVD